ncbi:MAG: hypothetical protein HWN68_14760 [Desulfobacterales bacterium]|nr:hypothetical protein [Desulfobacterales bacterium]
MLALVLGRVQVRVQVRVQEPALALAQEPALALAQERELGLHRQPSSRLTTMPAGLTIFSFSSIKIPPFRFWSAKDYSTAESYHPPSLEYPSKGFHIWDNA